MLLPIFPKIVILTYLFLLLAISTIWYVVAKEKNEKNYFLFSSSFLAIQIALNAGITLLKLFLSTHLIFSLHMIYFFQGRMSSVLTVPQFERKIESLEQLLESQQTILMPDFLKEKFLTSSNPLARITYEKTESLTNTVTDRLELVLRNNLLPSNIFTSSLDDASKLLIDWFYEDLLPIFEFHVEENIFICCRC